MSPMRAKRNQKAVAPKLVGRADVAAPEVFTAPSRVKMRELETQSITMPTQTPPGTFVGKGRF